jgi:energy-coupling factor transport system ATP-binding protein
MSIKIENLNFQYMIGTPFEKKAIDDVSLEIKDGEFIGLIGHTGSGKSTLIQQFNGLLKPTSGRIYINDICITDKGANLKKIRQEVGLVFQYTEHQLFEETVYKDIAFGPLNLGLSEVEVVKRAKRALNIVGMDFDYYKEISPFDLSGGQKRRVAIAGVLAMEPKILILDEPTAGLDPKGRDEILGEIYNLHKEYNMTIILVTHSMEEVAKLADRLIVMYKGKNIMSGTPREIFMEAEKLEKIGLGVPQVTYLFKELKRRGFTTKDGIITVEEAKVELLRLLGGELV